jgi:hypothetical protein
MTNFFGVKRHFWALGALGAFLACGAYLIVRRPVAPAVPHLSRCKALGPGMRRIGDRGLQFDVSTSDLIITEGTSDAAPLVHGFDLKPANSTSVLTIEFGWRPLDSLTADPALTLSKHVEKRSIFDEKGKSIGEDDWGYLDSGERWRRIRFSGIGTAKYGFVNKSEAETFDEVVNSVCLAPGSSD